MDIPPTPLYKEAAEKNTLPQVLLFDLLKKFDGVTYTENKDGNRIKYRIKKLPKYLVLHMKRFTHNSFYLEKNTTLVSFPVNNLDLKNCKEFLLRKKNINSIRKMLMWMNQIPAPNIT